MATSSVSKPCRECGEVKTLDQFSLARKGMHGRRAKCKECVRNHHAANAERVHAQQAKYREANRERLAERKAAYHRANRDRKAEYDREYMAMNADRLREQNAAYYRANRESKAERDGRRRAAKRAASIGPIDLDLLWTGDCGICGAGMDRDLKRPHPLSKSIDHIIPLARGGSHAQDNLQWAHLRCNLSKGARVEGVAA